MLGRYGGGGLFVYGGGTVTLKRSIVSGNTLSTPGDARSPSRLDGAVTADDYNLFGHEGDAGVEGFTPGSTDIVPNKPIGGILLPLADNGGETQHARARDRQSRARCEPGRCHLSGDRSARQPAPARAGV